MHTHTGQSIEETPECQNFIQGYGTTIWCQGSNLGCEYSKTYTLQLNYLSSHLEYPLCTVSDQLLLPHIYIYI